MNSEEDPLLDKIYPASSDMILLVEDSAETYNIVYDIEEHLNDIGEQYSRTKLNFDFSGIDENILKFFHRKIGFTGFMHGSVALYNGKPLTTKTYQFDEIQHALGYFQELKNQDKMLFVYTLIFCPCFYTDSFIDPSEMFLLDKPRLALNKPYWRIRFATISAEELI